MSYIKTARRIRVEIEKKRKKSFTQTLFNPIFINDQFEFQLPYEINELNEIKGVWQAEAARLYRELMEERSKIYGPVESQMETIGVIQAEHFQYCMDRNGSKSSRKALAHLVAMNQGVVKIVRSVSNPDHKDNYQDLRNFATIAKTVKGEPGPYYFFHQNFFRNFFRK